MQKHSPQTEKQEAIARLREWLKPGDAVYTILRHVSRSGMQREIGIVVWRNGEPLHPNWAVSKALDLPLAKGDGVKVRGCGMDMGFHVVYELGRVLFPDGFGVKGEMPYGHEITPKDKHGASVAVAKGAKFHGRNGDTSGWDNDGGYALKHRWL